ncbi:transmembrane protein 183 isoform X2 [Scaptodrosophila lebanonensis]|nr:transmembrane protein 183 isoform X2 [Scaptodrosophila lebanonensis]
MDSVHIKHDIWFHISMYIAPEDVQSFALICKQTAKLVNTRAFWRNLYTRYCLSATGTAWNLELPTQLQLDQLRNCDTKALRSLVVESLYHCYRPLKERMDLGYSLDWLLQRQFMSCWQIQYQCLWIVCYKLWNQETRLEEIPLEQNVAADIVSDWETLVDNSEPIVKTTGNLNEGVVLLIVLCRQFVPIPAQLSYSSHQARYFLKATRELLSTDMRATNLELDFAEGGTSNNFNSNVTVKYTKIAKYRVLPWWHPDFKRFVK